MRNSIPNWTARSDSSDMECSTTTELFNNGKPDQALEEYSIMMNGLEKVFRQFPTGRTLYFLNAHHRELANNLQILGQDKILEQLAIMDPTHKAIYLFKSNSR